MNRKVGSFTIDGSNSVSKVVTGLGFQPQVLILEAVQLTADGTGTTDIRTSQGMTDGTSQYAGAFSTGDNLTASEGRIKVWNDSVLGIMTYGGTVLARMAHGSFDSDGFTLSTVTTPTVTVLVKYIALGGLTNVHLGVYTLPAATGNFSKTEPGFQPDMLYALTHRALAFDTTYTNGLVSRGWTAGGNQFCVTRRGVFNVTTNYSSSSAATDAVMLGMDHGGNVVVVDAGYVSFNSNGYTLNRVTGTGANYVAVLTVKGGTWKVGTTTAQSGTGTFDVTTTGLDPQVVLLGASNHTTASRTTPFEGANVSVGASDGTSEWALTDHSFNNETLNPNVTEEYVRAASDRMWLHYDRSAANTFSATGEIALSSFGTEKFTLNQTDGDPTAVLIGYLAGGTAASGGSTLVREPLSIKRGLWSALLHHEQRAERQRHAVMAAESFAAPMMIPPRGSWRRFQEPSPSVLIEHSRQRGQAAEAVVMKPRRWKSPTKNILTVAVGGTILLTGAFEKAFTVLLDLSGSIALAASVASVLTILVSVGGSVAMASVLNLVREINVGGLVAMVGTIVQAATNVLRYIVRRGSPRWRRHPDGTSWD